VRALLDEAQEDLFMTEAGVASAADCQVRSDTLLDCGRQLAVEKLVDLFYRLRARQRRRWIVSGHGEGRVEGISAPCYLITEASRKYSGSTQRRPLLEAPLGAD
jgi:hypothetical protein